MRRECQVRAIPVDFSSVRHVLFLEWRSRNRNIARLFISLLSFVVERTGVGSHVLSFHHLFFPNPFFWAGGRGGGGALLAWEFGILAPEIFRPWGATPQGDGTYSLFFLRQDGGAVLMNLCEILGFEDLRRRSCFLGDGGEGMGGVGRFGRCGRW